MSEDDILEFTVGPFVVDIHECAGLVIRYPNGDEDVFIDCDCEYARSLPQLKAEP